MEAIDLRLTREHVKDVLGVCAELSLAVEERDLEQSPENAERLDRVQGHFRSISEVFWLRDEADRIEKALKAAR